MRRARWFWQTVIVPSKWSLMLAFVGLIGWYLVGEKNPAGWIVGIVNQVLFFMFGIRFKQYGFLITAVCLTSLYTWNLYQWTK